MDKKLNFVLPCIILGTTAILLRLFALGNIPGLLGDEAWGYAQVQLFLKGIDYTLITPSGRLYSPIHALIIYITRAAEPFWIRFPAFLQGSITAVISYNQFKKITSKDTALISALILSTFPVHFLYSRYAWECSLIPLFGIFITKFILEKCWIKAVALILISFPLVHPTMIFFLPPLLLPFYNELKDKNLLPKLIYQIIFACILIIAAGLYVFFHDMPIYIPTFEGFMKYTLGVSDFWSGTIISQKPKNYFILIFNLIFLSCVISLSVLHFKKFKKFEKKFFIGMGISLFLLFLLRSVTPVIAGHERAILFSGVPLCLYLGLLLSHFRWGKIVGMFLSVVYIGIIVFLYFAPFLETGGQGIQTHTGPEDPKYAATKWVLEHAQHNNELKIVAEDWGIYWNFYNYALTKSDFKIKIRQASGQQGFDEKLAIKNADQLHQFIGENGYVIGFNKGRVEYLIIQLMEKGFMFSRIGFKDYAGENYIFVWIPEKK
jgi:hypothetical protein